MTHILVTNDDGIDAPGLWALARAIQEIPGTRVTIVAPDRQRSAISNALSLYVPVTVIQREPGVYVIDGTPTDAVLIGVNGILKRKPDFVFSGINLGRNMGEDTHYSGTVGAAIEGAVLGISSVAFSQVERETDFTTTALFAKKMLRLLKKNRLPAGVVLNVNVPARVRSLDFEIASLGHRDYRGLCLKQSTRGRKSVYKISGHHYRFFNVGHSDASAAKKHKISVTPLMIDMTDTLFMKKMKQWKRP